MEIHRFALVDGGSDDRIAAHPDDLQIRFAMPLTPFIAPDTLGLSVLHVNRTRMRLRQHLSDKVRRVHAVVMGRGWLEAETVVASSEDDGRA